MMRTMRVLLLLALAASTAQAAAPTVAVMRFRDLSGDGGAIGDAISETVTTDLKQLGEVRVVERGALDRVLAELKLQGTGDLDPQTLARVGKLLGATLIVNGAYQKALPRVRLTARFVRVETGEIIGTAKVDGRATELLRLEDQITAELLRSAGLAAPASRLTARTGQKPVLKSLKTMELYGDAVLERDDHKKHELLKQALDEDAAFTYAVKDLEELERRMRGYEAAAGSAYDRDVQDTRQKIAHESDPNKQAQLAVQLLNLLQQSHRTYTLRTEARKLAASPSPGTLGILRLDEVASFYLVQADSMLRDRDATLRDGEEFLRRFPTSMYFTSVKGIMDMAIAAARAEDEGRAQAKDAIGKLRSQEPCDVARQYQRYKQWADAERWLRKCAAGGADPKQALADLVYVEIERAAWNQARADAAALAKQFPDYYVKSVKATCDAMIPADSAR
jgi:TolB-like protein